MIKLRDLLAILPTELIAASEWQVSDHPALEQEVTGISTNSWACQPGHVFIGMPGTRVNGGSFWSSALEAGAIAALVSPEIERPALAQAFVLPMADLPRVCAMVAAAFYGHPSRQMPLVGVTGTNGKTTTTHLIEHLLNQTQHPTALLGTLYARWPGYQTTATHTTPFAVDLQQHLAQAVAAGCQFGVMEVSSHALAQQRVLGCEFTAAAFTNLTQDHLDYHKDLEDYFAAKALLFSADYLKGRAILNQEDAFGRRLIEACAGGSVWTYSTQENADLWVSDLRYTPEGVAGILNTPSGSTSFQSPLVGQFNVSNVLAAIGVGLHLGLDLDRITAGLATFPGVPGRVQQVRIGPDQDISVIVDYAHTPDSLENLLTATRPFVAGQLICVFGCGGDRDRTKRPQMGAIAARLADVAVVTSDNPRTEDPQQILADIIRGIPAQTRPMVEVDRRTAIHQAIAQAQPGDSVLIAGKGHEDYQILGTEKIHFDDREEAEAALQTKYGFRSMAS
uniref:UDP-N-acetylmuramoyl-L-alanyl-D-glutamate--2, 6-diaminopimelate ligase n=1 Tax=Petrachloros mirabilis TaxID=2918835 RepID=UPI001EE7C831|nr:UDP-N-acetylmuramoyl-L-alanyl-D-glutamate--2,6-diaminopimelate ligase [Petrachloros mirabilis]